MLVHLQGRLFFSHYQCGFLRLGAFLNPARIRENDRAFVCERYKVLVVLWRDKVNVGYVAKQLVYRLLHIGVEVNRVHKVCTSGFWSAILRAVQICKTISKALSSVPCNQHDLFIGCEDLSVALPKSALRFFYRWKSISRP